MAIRHEITLYALSDEAKAQRKLRIAVSAGIVLVVGLVGWANNPLEPEGLSKLQVAIGSIAAGYVLQAVCFIVFNAIALDGDKIARSKALSAKCDSGEPDGSTLSGTHYFAGLFMMFGFLIAVIGGFEEGFHVLGTVATVINIGVWIYVFKTTKC